MDDYTKKFEELKTILFAGGGTPQANMLLQSLMSPFDGFPSMNAEDVLTLIGQQITSLRRIMYTGGVMNAKAFISMMKDYIPKGKEYVCLDNDLKFCIKKYGTDNFDDALYIFPYMNLLTAHDICNKEEYPKTFD